MAAIQKVAIYLDNYVVVPSVLRPVSVITKVRGRGLRI